MGQIYNSDSIALSSAGGGCGTSFTVDGIGPDDSNNIQLNADSYCGTWQSGTTYRLNNIVSETVNGIPGLYVCLAETSSAEPSGSSDWRRIAGTASAIDGLSVNSKGNIEYNRSLEPASETVTPQCTGELSWTINIDGPVAVDLSRFTDTLFNTNPASVIRLVINAGAPYDVTFTGSDAYWTQDSGYSNVPPVISLDGTDPLTVVEVSLITDRLVPGVLVRTVFPAETSGGGNGESIIIIQSGQTFDPLTAGRGVYSLGAGVIMQNGPGSGILDISTAVVTVRIPGESVNLIVYAHFNQSSGYNHCGEYEFIPGDGSVGARWSSLGPGDSANPTADTTYVLVASLSSQSVGLSLTHQETFTTLLAGKAYGMLTEEEDGVLRAMTVTAMDVLRGREGSGS